MVNARLCRSGFIPDFFSESGIKPDLQQELSQMQLHDLQRCLLQSFPEGRNELRPYKVIDSRVGARFIAPIRCWITVAKH